MRALCLVGPRQAAVREVPEPQPGPGEVLVAVKACGLCASDLNAWRGVPGIDYPLPPGAPGHEVWGEIVGSGQTVTGLVWNGLAERSLARAEHLVRLAPPFDTTLLLGEPLACALNVVRRARVQPGQRVALVGFGYLAALVVQLLPEHTAAWIALARRGENRELALRLGAEAAYDFAAVPERCWDQFEVVIEAAGVQSTLDYASWLVAYGGRLVIAGYHADGPRSVNLQSWNWKGIDVINAHERQPAVYVAALRTGLQLVRERRLDLAGLISHRFGLDDSVAAFEAADVHPPGFLKAVVFP
jgi:threonine dehydrogenase-like Zn-dependent dehydrogenase